MNIFIDAGSNNFKTIEQFKREGKIDDSYKVYAFDPASKWEQGERKAVWIEDCQIKLSKNKNDESPTLISDNPNYNEGEYETVEAFDFSTWLKQFSEKDHIILKMDIEGAEYAVLEKMIKDGTAKLIDELYVEFHDWFMPEYTERTQKIKDTLDIKDWL